MRRVAIIPARSGSKRIPGKNIRNFHGKPIIQYTLEAASKSELFDLIHVSTDSMSIKNLCAKLGHEPDFMRPSELADDQTPILPVLRHVVTVLEEQGEIFDEVWMLMACAPLITYKDLRNVAKYFTSAKLNYQKLIPIAEYPTPIEWALRRNDDDSVEPRFPSMLEERSQDLPKSYYDAGCFTTFCKEAIYEDIGSNNFIGYEIPKWKAIDIDTEDDWLFAELLYGKYRMEC